ncbi:hypothetical protein BDD43_0828 [Mucilaginibacter gracilis]|uniref:Uncharacterized protein n=1 Tax=Mucilaginibacter gracilis TaxID=423350 RepID=A0A495IVB2_9SPHI|nr:hypothetical protein [Mucilaginibacter gracilis]RKR80696.1 hypothetical protein BDD43_0828 [Mucilaginibacter gracilis]
MNYYMSLSINLSAASLPVICGAFRYRLLEKSLRVLYWLTVFSLITECFAFMAALRYHNNLAVYNTSAIIETVFIAMFFNYSIEGFRRAYIGFYIGLVSVVVGLLDFIFLEPIDGYGSHYFLYETLLIITCGIILFAQLIRSPGHLRVQYNPHFWIVVTLIVFYLSNFFAMSCYESWTKILGTRKSNIDDAILLFSALVNCLLASVFAFYPQMKKSYERS